MFKLRDVCIFVAGAAFFHMISHILLPFYVDLPYKFGCLNITTAFNNGVIAVSAIVTIGLLWVSTKLKR
ncbi:MAG: hypothetical protein FJZ60_04980 [Chlamydiae bacterium]|nr:hypothetical protein [Chlamydiota bacterium]